MVAGGAENNYITLRTYAKMDMLIIICVTEERK